MFPGAGWTAPPGRIEWRGRRKDECLHLSVHLGGSHTVTSPPGRVGSLGQISSNTGSLCAPRQPCHSHCLPTTGWTTKPHMAAENTYGLNVMMPFTCVGLSLPLTSILAQLTWQLQLAVKKILHTALYLLLCTSWNNTLVKLIYSSIFYFFNTCSCVCEFARVNLGDWPSPWQTVAIWPRGLETDTVC